LVEISSGHGNNSERNVYNNSILYTMQTRLLVLLGEHVNGKYNIFVDNPVRMSIYSMLKTRVTNDLDNKNIKWSVMESVMF